MYLWWAYAELCQFQNYKKDTQAAYTGNHGIDDFTKNLPVAQAHILLEGGLHMWFGITFCVQEMLHECEYSQVMCWMVWCYGEVFNPRFLM